VWARRLAFLGLFGCAPHVEPVVPVLLPPPKPAPTATVGRMEGAPAVSRQGLASCEKARIDVSFSAMHGFRRASWVRAILHTEPRFAELEMPNNVDPLEVIERGRFCGARMDTWEAVVFRHTLSDAAVDGALRAYGARVDGGGPVDLGVTGVRATRIRIATEVWTAVRRDKNRGELWLVAPEAARDSLTLHSEMATFDVPNGVVAVAELAAPRDRMVSPADEIAELVSLHVEVRLTPEGGAQILGTGVAQDERSARAIADRMNERVARSAGSFFVRVALRGVLSGFSARAEGKAVAMALPVSAPQLDSVLSLLGAHLGAHFDAESGAAPSVEQANPKPVAPK
jgi:hypothetical protein